MPAITDVEFREFSNRPVSSRNWLVVKLNTDQPGLFGLGDASSMGNEEQTKDLIRMFVSRYLVGKDPLDSEVHWTNMYHDSNVRGGRLGSTALSGIDIALWDLKGKILGLPSYTLLGGAHRDRLRTYANGWYNSRGTPEQMAEEARRVVEMGYTALKFDPFGPNYYTISLEQAQLAEDRVAAVREAVGPYMDILVEVHAKFNVMNAIQLGRRMEPYRPLVFEEPVSQENISELVEVRRKLNVPIATGERLYTKFPFAQIVEAHAADVLQPDIANAGGITELKKIAAIAEPKHITVAPHDVSSPVGLLAALHVDASIINFEIQEYHAEFYSEHYYTVFRGLPRPVDGYVTLSDAPGLGLEMDEDVIAAHPPVPASPARSRGLRGI